MRRLGIVLFWPLVALAQPSPLNVRPTNLDFSEGESGAIPSGWSVPNQAALDAGYTVQLRRGDCPQNFAACTVFRSPGRPTTIPAIVLGQTFPALAYLGKTVRFGAWLRAQGQGANIEVRMRFNHADGSVQFFDAPNGPVTVAEAQWREVEATVASGVVSISIWARFHPSGTAWIFEPTFFAAQQDAGDDEAVRALIQRFSELRNAHDGDAVAEIYSENGEYSSSETQFTARGREALAALWSGVTGRVGRTIESIEFPGGDVSLVRVLVQFPEAEGPVHDLFLMVKESGVWRIRLHRAIG